MLGFNKVHKTDTKYVVRRIFGWLVIGEILHVERRCAFSKLEWKECHYQYLSFGKSCGLQTVNGRSTFPTAYSERMFM